MICNGIYNNFSDTEKEKIKQWSPNRKIQF